MELGEIMAKILVVEDDQTISMGLEYYLVQEGFEVVLAGSIQSALLELSKNTSFDLALLDLGLPDGNGFDLYQKMKEKYQIQKP